MAPFASHQQQSSAQGAAYGEPDCEGLQGEAGGQGRYHNHEVSCCWLAAAILAMFLPLGHPPGYVLRADFGERSDACFVSAYPEETTEPICEGDEKIFEFFAGVLQSILYDADRARGRSACESAKFHCL